LTVEAYGVLANWNATGEHAVHAVDRSGSGDWAVMLYGSDSAQTANVISLASLVSANDAGKEYTVSFQGAAADYSSSSQGNEAGDTLEFDVLRSDGSTLYSYSYQPAYWTDASVNPFTDASFTYTGDGSGNVGLSITAVTGGDGHFGGAVDNLTIESVPEPTTWALMVMGLAAIGGGLRRRFDRSTNAVAA
jgi:hypothetical protein